MSALPGFTGQHVIPFPQISDAPGSPARISTTKLSQLTNVFLSSRIASSWQFSSLNLFLSTHISAMSLVAQGLRSKYPESWLSCGWRFLIAITGVMGLQQSKDSSACTSLAGNGASPAEIRKMKLMISNHTSRNTCTPPMCWLPNPNSQMRLRKEPINAPQVMQCDIDNHEASALLEILREHLLSPLLCCMLDL